MLHQTSRTAGARGQAMRIDSGNYGGETHATFQIGVWRKRAAIAAELDDLQARTYKTEMSVNGSPSCSPTSQSTSTRSPST